MSKNILSKINNKFKINKENGLYSLTDIKSDDLLPQRLIRSLSVIKPNYIFIFNSKPIILFFDKDKDKNVMFKQCWNFAEAPIVIIENESNFEIYNGFDFIIKSKSLREIDTNDNEINYISLISGKYLENSKKIFENKNTKLDINLLKNIKEAREILLKFNISQHIANSLIGRIIFIRYLIDRNVKFNFNNIFDSEDIELKKEELKRVLCSKEETYALFRYLKSDDGFNGDWFPIDEEKEKIVTEKHLLILKNLTSGTYLKTNQPSLFDIYDFSIIPIEFISNVYESFIGDENQKKDGAYYTPTFLVDYILKYTVDDYFKKNPKEYNCKILDPACGSGIFLVETFRKLVSQHERVKGKPINSKQIIQLVKDNIFAIDKNEEALSISVFSLYLAMLDYQNPKDIEKFKFPYLLDTDKNKDTPNFYNDDFFDIEASYNKIMKNNKIDFIIGNPPYGGSTIKKDSFANKYINTNKIKVGNKDIVQAFMIRVKDIVSQNTKISFIVTSKVLYNLKAKVFRTEYFFNQFKVNHILELSSVRNDIFENADTPVSILFYEYNKEESIQNEINYISMKPNPYFKKFKILMLSKNDFKKVLQSKLVNNDYLWKILVYGSYFDFNFINRLKSFITIDKYIENGKDKEQGITLKGKDKNSTLEYIGMPYIQTKQIKPFYIEKSNLIWKERIAHRKKSISFFKAPSLLISKGIDEKLDLRIGILQQNSIFTDSITSVKHDNKDSLYGLMGILYSSFFKYYIMNIGSSVGIERPQVHNPEKFSLPYIQNKEIVQSTKNIEKYSSNTFAQYDKEFDSLKDKLNKNVLKAFNLNEQEYSLVDYANNIIIPWVVQNKYEVAFESLKFKDKRLNEYINIFIKHYSNIYEQNNMYFSAEILWDKYAIGIYFKVLDKKPDNIITWKKEKNIQNFLKLSNTMTLENLFIQKDIKGFESDGFYVVKPNEYKNWHKAIGYLDFYEFDKSILKAGR
ncbi:MAG: hypothetical protein DRG78_13845 [Epsilonproteobacteria bacterium]|nr:MAG: hypothetical protein DRG78_13845 [Campylobacterota bacterium]